ncbi:MAG: two-component sensor histidine kinase, partial [Flavobacteriaceae bacterium]|nr:two-component sensor histidine kinase [Flavobacteriaceae bacterium]
EANEDLIFSSVQGMNIYRIIQEGVNNALKYADAEEINVTIIDNDLIEIVIEDNGSGFDESDIEYGNGLKNMKKRAQDINAELSVNSTKNKGTIITVALQKNA